MLSELFRNLIIRVNAPKEEPCNCLTGEVGSSSFPARIEKEDKEFEKLSYIIRMSTSLTENKDGVKENIFEVNDPKFKVCSVLLLSEEILETKT